MYSSRGSAERYQISTFNDERLDIFFKNDIAVYFLYIGRITIKIVSGFLFAYILLYLSIDCLSLN